LRKWVCVRGRGGGVGDPKRKKKRTFTWGKHGSSPLAGREGDCPSVCRGKKTFCLLERGGGLTWEKKRELERGIWAYWTGREPGQRERKRGAFQPGKGGEPVTERGNLLKIARRNTLQRYQGVPTEGKKENVLEEKGTIAGRAVKGSWM